MASPTLFAAASLFFIELSKTENTSGAFGRGASAGFVVAARAALGGLPGVPPLGQTDSGVRLNAMVPALIRINKPTLSHVKHTLFPVSLTPRVGIGSGGSTAPLEHLIM